MKLTSLSQFRILTPGKCPSLNSCSDAFLLPCTNSKRQSSIVKNQIISPRNVVMPSSSASASTSTQALLDAERGLNLLLNDDLNGARSTLESQKESPYALAGLGIVAFLTAAIGLEEDRLQSSSNTLALAENAAKKRKTSSSTGISDPGQWWTQSGTEYDVLLADVVAAQSVSSTSLLALEKTSNTFVRFSISSAIAMLNTRRPCTSSTQASSTLRPSTRLFFHKTSNPMQQSLQ